MVNTFIYASLDILKRYLLLLPNRSAPEVVNILKPVRASCGGRINHPNKLNKSGAVVLAAARHHRLTTPEQIVQLRLKIANLRGLGVRFELLHEFNTGLRRGLAQLREASDQRVDDVPNAQFQLLHLRQADRIED